MGGIIQTHTESSKIVYNIQHMKLKVGIFCVLALTAFSGCGSIEDTVLRVPGPGPGGGNQTILISRAIPGVSMMRLEWVNPDSDNITGFNVSWTRLSDNVTGMENKADGTDAKDNAFYVLTGLMDEREHRFFVHAVIRGGTPILVLDLTATTGANHDSDGEPDFLDDDDDNDGKDDVADTVCPRGAIGWISNATSDYDSDGCRDEDEDLDDDNDGVPDTGDLCATNATDWTSNPSTDNDGDGCRDSDEDLDDDNDMVPDTADACPNSDSSTSVTSRGCLVVSTGNLNTRAVPMQGGMRLEWTNPSASQNPGTIEMFTISWERLSDNAKGTVNKDSQTGAGVNASDVLTGLMDDEMHRFLVRAIIPGEDPILILNLTATTGANYDNDSEPDSLDNDDDNDGVGDAEDIVCPRGQTGWTSNSSTDYDGDGCRDGFAEETDFDNDNVADTEDACPRSPANMPNSVTPRGCLTVPAGSLNTRAVPMQEGMRLEWTNPSDAQLPGNIAWFNVSWKRLSDDATGMQNKTDERAAEDNASYELTGLIDEVDHLFLVYAIIPGEDPILILNLTATTGANYDNDGEPDSLDDDDDNDGVGDTEDIVCPRGQTGWTSDSSADHDGDGCRDGFAEETDDDNDGIDNPADNCARGALGWTSDLDTDFDQDGCRDRDEDMPIFEQDSYAFEFPPDTIGRINEVTVRNPVTEFVLGGMTTNITIDRQAQTGVLSAVGALAAGMYVLHVNASNAFGETRANITLNVTDRSIMLPVFSRERTVIRLSPGDTYGGEPNLLFQDSFTIAEAEYGGEKVPGRGDFTELGDIFGFLGFDAAGNFSINQPIDVSNTRGLFLRINASNSAGESEAFVHILVTDPSNRTLYFASDGSVETIGEVHPVMPDNATLRFNIASGNQTLFGINNTGILSVNVTNVLQNRTHYLGIEEEYAGGTRFFANVTVFGRTPGGKNRTHVYWLAENEWLKEDGSEQLPKIDAVAGDQLVFLCPNPMLATAFPGPNVWYTQNKTVADNCRPDQFADPAPAVFIGACDAAGKEIPVLLEDPLDADNPVRFEEDNSYYFMSFSGGTEEETTSAEFKTGAACQAGMKFRLNVLSPPNISP